MKHYLEKNVDPRINMEVLRFVKEIGPHNWSEFASTQVLQIRDRYLKENQIIQFCIIIRAMVLENYSMEQQTDPNKVIQSLSLQKQNNSKIESTLKKIRKTHKLLKELDSQMKKITSR